MGLKRIRFTTSHPLDMTDDLIEILWICTSISQSTSSALFNLALTEILKAMKRNYTADLYRDIIERVKKIRPTIKVTSDFIVGFPGETDIQNFLRLCS